MSIQEFNKVINHFKHVNFCGQVSDPVHHPKFIEFLELLYKNNSSVSVHHATAAKPRKWYPKAFQANPDARWWFGIDGLPNESHKYRINQDGEKLFDIMVEATKHLKTYPIWQYIVFKYNQDHVEYCKEWAKDIGCKFKLVLSGKATDFFIEDFEKFIPTNKKYRIARNNDNDNLSQFQTYMNVVENEKE